MENHATESGTLVLTAATAWTALSSAASPPGTGSGGEANLVLPDLGSVSVMGGVSGTAAARARARRLRPRLGFGMVAFNQVRGMPAHESMLDVSELIYETCKTYLVTAGQAPDRALGLHRRVIVVYFGFLIDFAAGAAWRVLIAFSLVGIPGSYGVAWFGIRVNTFANCRTAFASLERQAAPVYEIPLQAGMSIGMLLICVELIMMLVILLFVPGETRRRLLHRLRDRRVARRGGAAHRGRHLHQDRRHRLRPDEDRVQDQGGRRAQPRRDRRLHRRQRGRLGRPDGRRLRDLRRHRRRAHHVHRCSRVPTPSVQAQLLVWIFVMRILMILTSTVSYLDQRRVARAQLRGRRQDQLRARRSRASCGSPRSSRSP